MEEFLFPVEAPDDFSADLQPFTVSADRLLTVWARAW